MTGQLFRAPFQAQVSDGVFAQTLYSPFSICCSGSNSEEIMSTGEEDTRESGESDEDTSKFGTKFDVNLILMCFGSVQEAWNHIRMLLHSKREKRKKLTRKVHANIKSLSHRITKFQESHG